MTDTGNGGIRRPSVRIREGQTIVSRTRIFTLAAASVGVALVGLTVATLTAWGGGDTQAHVHAIVEVLAGLVAATAAGLAARRSSGRRRWAWACFAGYALAITFGDCVLIVYELVLRTPVPFPSIADIGYALSTPVGVAGALAMRSKDRRRTDTLVLVLDALVIGSCVLLVSWAVFLGAVFDDSGSSMLTKFAAVAYPVGDVVILTVLVVALLSTPAAVRRSLQYVTAGIVAVLIADSTLTYVSATGGSSTGGSFELLWIASLCGVGLGALHALCRERVLADRPARTGRSVMGMAVPLACVAVACGFTVDEYLDSGRRLSPVFIGALVAIVLLVSVRQLLAFRMILRLGEELAHQALHDDLTGLANRSLLRERLGSHDAAGAADAGRMALLIIDLDGFKDVNDTYGHDAGDELLVSVAGRIAAEVRGGDTVARLGGDEFAVVLDGASLPAAVRVARRVLSALEAPIALGRTTVQLSGSIGIAHSRGDLAADELLRCADLAMYQAKAAGRGSYSVFRPEMHAAVTDRVALERDLRGAADRGELFLRYQPVVDLQTSRMVSVEALVRWNRPGHGMVAPDGFIGLAEETGMIVPIGAWVVGEACRQLAAWQRVDPAARELAMSVNISPRQLLSRELVDVVREALRRSGVRPDLLTLEVTETALMQDMDAAVSVLRQLKGLGVRLALDDFGIGSSSLGRLRHLPIDVIKIDKSFVDHIPDGALATALVGAISGIVAALHLQSVVEGVERADQAAHLRSAGYELAQGYYFARPLEPAAVAGLLSSGRALGGGDGDALPQWAGRRVLVVEDDEASGAAACRILRSAGHETELVRDCAAAWEALSGGDLDAAVVDIQLPGGDGWSVVERMRADSRLATTPVVVMTGLLDTVDVLHRAATLRCEYLGKPFPAQALVAKLDQATRAAAA